MATYHICVNTVQCNIPETLPKGTTYRRVITRSWTHSNIILAGIDKVASVPGDAFLIKDIDKNTLSLLTLIDVVVHIPADTHGLPDRFTDDFSMNVTLSCINRVRELQDKHGSIQ